MKHTESYETFHYLVAQCLTCQDWISLSQWETFTYISISIIFQIYTELFQLCISL